MVYVLDANVFIEANNRHYGLDFCPAFWDWLLRENNAGKVCSIDKVYDELQKGKDDLSIWANKNESFFRPLHSGVSSHTGRISAWVTSRTPAYKQAAQTEFLGGNADYWLIAHSMAAGSITLVTSEVAALDAKKRVKIPDVCSAMSVPYMLPFQMLRTEKAKFVL